MASSQACSSYELGLSETLPYAVHLRLPSTVREEIEKAYKNGLPVNLHFGRDHSDGNLCVGGQDFRFRAQTFTGQNKLVQHPLGLTGKAEEVAIIHQKCQVVHRIDSAPGGRTKQVTRGAQSKTGLVLAAKAAAATQQLEEDSRKRAAERRVPIQNDPGKTTAPEKMKLAIKQFNKPASGGGAKRVSSQVVTEDRAGKDKAAVLVPTSPTEQMMEAAKQHGMRGCIMALMYPPGMKVPRKTLTTKVANLVTDTLSQTGTPHQELPSPSTIQAEFKRMTFFQAPGAYVLKDECREEYKRMIAQAKGIPPQPEHQSGAADHSHGSQPSAFGNPEDADDSEPVPDPLRITKRRRILSSTAKTQVWAPFGDAAHRLAAVPSTAAAERAEREALEAVMRDREHGTSEATYVAAKQLKQPTNTSRKPTSGIVPETLPACDQMDGALDSSISPRNITSASKASQDVKQETTQPDSGKWFFSEHLHRQPVAYPDVTSEEQVAKYEAEFKSKFAVLLKLNKKIRLYKEEVESVKRKASAESRIKELWAKESEYLICMDRAFRLLSKELDEMKTKAKQFRRRELESA